MNTEARMLDEEPNLSEGILAELFADERPPTKEERLELWRLRRQIASGQVVQIRGADLEDDGGRMLVSVLLVAIGFVLGLMAHGLYRWLFPAGFLAVTATELLTQIQGYGGC